MSPVQSIPPPTVTLATPNNNTNLHTNITTTATANNTTIKRTRKTMSDALSIANITQKQMSYDPAGAGTAAVSVEQSAVAAVAAAYQYNYQHLYADRAAAAAAAMYAAPPMIFSAPAHSTPVPAHANYKYNTNNNNNANTDSNTVFSYAYCNAIQHAVKAGIFSPTQLAAQIPPPSPAIPAPTLTPPTPTLPKSPNLHIPLTATSPPLKTSPGGTYLNEKAFHAKPTSTTENNYFKVPSGKEGSMKHRILTRPQNNNNTQTVVFAGNNNNCSQETAQNAVMRTYETTSNFRKGSYIELANGVLRKVEDMRTEDFIQCADRSPHHKLAESTVVKIDLTTANMVIITFSYDNNRSRADVEVTQDHPFFVYGQGWASYNPETSAKVFGLRCQRLQVGDICISLTNREQSTQNEPASSLNVAATNTVAAATSSNTAINMTVTAATPPLQTNETNTRFSMPAEYASSVLPLSPHTPPAVAAAAAAAVLVPSSSHLNLPTPLAAAHYAAASHNIPFHLLPSHLSALGATAHPYSPDMAELVSAYAYHAHATAQPTAAKILSGYYHPVYHAESQAKKNKEEYKHVYHARYESLAPPPSHTDNHYHHHQLHAHHHQQQQQQQLLQQQQQQQHQHQQSNDEPVDATISRKRRWSAPEGVSDDDEHQRQMPQIPVAAHNGDNGGMYKIYKPAAVLGTTQI